MQSQLGIGWLFGFQGKSRKGLPLTSGKVLVRKLNATSSDRHPLLKKTVAASQIYRSAADKGK
ncbi:hypothetical protein [Scytonema millei]|uniref:Uncharacterized protein n=1 Tax=Scytonema millei VB511283 TaxID=1245923 RepID=A0A9X5I6R5_9CYAN|nr:hypothetical protein [Scytonema millei]NHC37350.1 hypothetical protein [Scytonema millei VB511283]